MGTSETELPTVHGSGCKAPNFAMWLVIPRRTTCRAVLEPCFPTATACGGGDDDRAAGGTADETANGMTQRCRRASERKRVGTPGGARAEAFLKRRMTELRLQDVHFEEFDFPMHLVDLARSSFSVTNGGVAEPPIAFDVFEGSGSVPSIP